MSELPKRIEATTSVKEAQNTEDGSRSVPLKLYVPDDTPVYYADSFNVFFSDYDYTLSFFQTEAPLIINDEDWADIEVIKSKCVARLIIPPHMIPRIVNILTENWKRFVEARRAQLQERENVNASTEAEANDAPSEGVES